MARLRPLRLLAMLALLFALLALARPVDHDESQYVASAALIAAGLLPYRDFGYFQTPLQPFVFAPVVWFAGEWAWPALRLANALIGAVAVAFVYRAARAGGADTRVALAAAGLFAACDVLLFSIGTARNDALPCALSAAALWLIVRGERASITRGAALAIGALLAAAAAAKISYVVPGAAYGLSALLDRRRLPGWVALGAVPVVAFVGWTYLIAPEGFVFGVFTFPALAPAEYYAARPWKLSWTAKGVDTLKFLALGAALPALATVVRAAWARWRIDLLDALIVAGLIAAVLPWPTWRQYLLPMLPVLFVRVALLWQAAPPTRGWRVALVVFAVAGLAPSLVAAAGAATGLPMAQAMADGRAIGRALEVAGDRGAVATVSPQYLPAARRLPDPRFAAGPFYFRSRTLLAGEAEARLRLVSGARLTPGAATVLVGGEALAPGGNPALDARLAAVARPGAARIDRIAGGRFTLYAARLASTRP